MAAGSRRKRVIVWGLAILAALVVAGGIALQVAIARNGPAVLDAVDRLAGSDKGSERIGPIAYGDHPAQKLFVHRLPHSERGGARAVLVFIHGGGWHSGDPQYYDFIGRNFAARGFLVVNLGYRLNSEGRFPAMLEDSASGLRWIRDNIAERGGDPKRIVLIGHSAGAYNAVMLALERQWLGREGLSSSDIAGVVGLAGPYDFHPFDSDSAIAAFGHSERPEATQPINHVRADAPPMLLVHGEEDTVVKPRNSRVLARAIGEAGGQVQLAVYPDFGHNDPLLALASPWQRWREIDDLVSEFARNPQASVPVQGENR